ncbi:MAG: maleylpyruvate isomerase family mycothiol-dependent enzyme [Actinomycetota bacterium]|nr:maleylpyruvate isomerase family mycothiol-dependent enzyme [Actinomycetota bacterium]
MAVLARLRKEHVFDGLDRAQEALIRLFSGDHLGKLVVELEGGIPMNDTEVWITIAAERIELAEFLETLTPEEWDAQSLCEEWKVRDVVAHLIFVTELGVGRGLVGVAKSGFNPNKYVARAAIAAGKQPPEDLQKQLRDLASSQKLPPLRKPWHLLADTVVQHQDIRRPLGKPRAIPAERVIGALGVANGIAGSGIKQRIAGLRLIATDMEWEHGDGPEVRGTGEALLMTLSGRARSLDELTGEGVARLRAR